MRQTKPTLERLEPNFGNSFTYKQFNSEFQNQSDTFWHYHPEIELVYVNEGSGKRLVGSHASYYRNGNLILIGSNLPHCGFTGTLESHQQETLVQMLPDFLGSHFFELPELKNVKQLLEKAKYGIVFHGDSKRKIGKKIESLSHCSHLERLIGLLEVFHMMEQTKEYSVLNAEGFILETKLEDHKRINYIFNFVQKEFKRHISLDEMAAEVNMTKPAFCRYFKKITGKTFVNFVNSYRLTHAAKILHEKQLSILDVSLESGFSNFSHFNKKFKSFTGRTPTQYRNELSHSVSE